MKYQKIFISLKFITFTLKNEFMAKKMSPYDIIIKWGKNNKYILGYFFYQY